MDNSSAQTRLNAIGVGKAVYLQGYFDFRRSMTSRYSTIVDIYETSLLIQRPSGLNNEPEIIDYQAISHISSIPPYPVFIDPEELPA